MISWRAFLVLAVLVSPLAARAQIKPRSRAAAAGASSSSGADSESGWILRKNADGTVVKVPKKQTFKFGSEVEGQASRPSQTIEGQRPSARQTSLIPVRQSFRQEVLDTVGYKGAGQ